MSVTLHTKGPPLHHTLTTFFRSERSLTSIICINTEWCPAEKIFTQTALVSSLKYPPGRISRFSFHVIGFLGAG